MKTLLANTKTLRQILEEAVSLLKMFWRAALPSSDGHAQYLQKVSASASLNTSSRLNSAVHIIALVDLSRVLWPTVCIFACVGAGAVDERGDPVSAHEDCGAGGGSAEHHTETEEHQPH